MGCSTKKRLYSILPRIFLKTKPNESRHCTNDMSKFRNPPVLVYPQQLNSEGGSLVPVDQHTDRMAEQGQSYPPVVAMFSF